MLRITTNGVLNSYRSDLNASAVSLNDARDTVLTQRNFNSYSEDPAAASQAFKLRSSWHKNAAQYSVSQSTIRKYNVAWTTLDSVEEMVDTTASSSALASALAGNSDPTGGGRTALGTQLLQLSESIVQVMNNTYADNFVFSGADGGTVPFTWGDDGTLYYRGVNVSPSKDDPDYDETMAALDALSSETNYVDIGLGMELDENGNTIDSSAFNNALQGINFLGYGTDKDGDSQNIVCIIYRLGELLSNCDEDGNWAKDEDADEFNRLINKLDDASDALKSAYVQLDARASFLESNDDQLVTKADTLNEEFLEIEQCDLADAITSFSWAQYCYNAALRVGNSILSQSLMDYLD
jgi:flagellar hook-associated protein 3 FlgL